MSQDYVLFQKCSACGTRKESTLNTIKAQLIFECACCALTLRVRPHEETQVRYKTARKAEALAV